MDTKALRQKILDLAIRGKLVPQDPTDEPASVLLERIRAEKQQMVKDGKLKPKDIKNDTVIFKGDDNLHYEKFADGSLKCIEDEIPFELPKGWEWTRLQSICSLLTDGTHKTPTYSDDGYIFLSSKNVTSGVIDWDNIMHIPESLHQELYKRLAPQRNDILLAKNGTTGIAALVDRDIIFDIYVSLALIRITDNIIKPSYILNIIGSSYVQNYFAGSLKGIGVPNLHLEQIRNTLLPIPPYSEQNRICSQLDELLPLAERIYSEKIDLKNLVDSAKAKILDLAIRGKLVPQDPNDEPASVLLERIRAEKEELIKQGKIKRDKKESVIFKGDDNSYYLRTESETMEITNELPYEIPESWEWERIGNVFQVNPRNKLDDSLEVSFIPMPLIDDGFSGKHTSEVRVWKKVKSGFTHFMEGDIGIAKITPCFENRKSVVFRNLKNNYGAGTTELHILRPYASAILPEYILAYVKSSLFIDNGKQEFTGAVGQQRISKDYVENSYFPIPPLTEQTRIVEQIHTVYKQLNSISDALL